MDLRRSLNGALAGAVAAGAWGAQEPLDRRAFGFPYSDIELLGRLVVRGPGWPAAGAGIHLANGAVFGALYAQLKPFLPGPAAVRGLAAALIEHAASWPLTALADRLHPARDELPPLFRSRRALAQSTWRHALFGVLLGLIEDRLNAERHVEPPPVEVSSNGYGDIEAAAGVATVAHAADSP